MASLLQSTCISFVFVLIVVTINSKPGSYSYKENWSTISNTQDRQSTSQRQQAQSTQQQAAAAYAQQQSAAYAQQLSAYSQQQKASTQQQQSASICGTCQAGYQRQIINDNVNYCGQCVSVALDNTTVVNQAVRTQSVVPWSSCQPSACNPSPCQGYYYNPPTTPTQQCPPAPCPQPYCPPPQPCPAVQCPPPPPCPTPYCPPPPPCPAVQCPPPPPCPTPYCPPPPPCPAVQCPTQQLCPQIPPGQPSPCQPQRNGGNCPMSNCQSPCQNQIWPVTSPQYTYPQQTQSQPSWNINAMQSDQPSTVDGYPVVTVEPAEVRVKPGEFVNLTCNTNGQEPLQFYWKSINNNFLPPHARLYKGSLIFKSIKKGDEGAYSCVAWNNIGQVSATATILLVGNKSVESSSGLSSIQPLSVSIPQKTVTSPAGKNVYLHCTTNKPNINVTWSRKSAQVPKSSKVMENGTLVLYRLRETDVGVYICRAEAAGQSAQAEATLAISLERNDESGV